MTLVDDHGAAAALIRDLERLHGVACADCATPVSAHDLLMDFAMGFKNAPRCLPCLAIALEEDASKLRETLLTYIRGRECFARAWNWASRESGQPEIEMEPLENQAEQPAPGAVPAVDATWDAGDQGCGELALELRMRLEKLRPGNVFQLTSRDLGAPADLPAWCGLTGHKLLRAEPPHYWIRRKD